MNMYYMARNKYIKFKSKKIFFNKNLLLET